MGSLGAGLERSSSVRPGAVSALGTSCGLRARSKDLLGVAAGPAVAAVAPPQHSAPVLTQLQKRTSPCGCLPHLAGTTWQPLAAGSKASSTTVGQHPPRLLPRDDHMPDSYLDNSTYWWHCGSACPAPAAVCAWVNHFSADCLAPSALATFGGERGRRLRPRLAVAPGAAWAARYGKKLLLRYRQPVPGQLSTFSTLMVASSAEPAPGPTRRCGRCWHRLVPRRVLSVQLGLLREQG